jgi:hypothetical protein
VSTVTSQALVGTTGVVTMPVRGGAKPGEIRVVVEGLPHYLIGYCTDALPAGTPILVINCRGPRQVDVEPWDAAKLSDSST